MTREEINALPMREYEGPVVVVRTPDEAAVAVGHLLKERVLGFDTETRPCFSRGDSYLPSILQLTAAKTTYLFQLRLSGFTKALRRLLSEPEIIKAGVAPQQDIHKLQELSHFRACGFVDVGEAARVAGIKNHGLRGLAAVLLGFKVSKRAQLTNWARDRLSTAQVRYAATDSWVSLEIYHHLKKLAPDSLKPMAPMAPETPEERRSRRNRRRSQRGDRSPGHAAGPDLREPAAGSAVEPESAAAG